MLNNGATIAGRYRLQRLIATGGMGQVWKALDARLDRRVAVKVLKAEFSADSTFRRRFRAEARTAAALNHPGIASVYDYGETLDAEGGEIAYLVMELVHGLPLNAVLRKLGRLTVVQGLDLLEQTGRALQVAHAAGVVHRDIKPGNILVSPDGQVKITDFGISKAVDASPDTKTGIMMGTAQYIAPERAVGEDATSASDVYSLGVVGYEALSGRRPFTGDAAVAVAIKHINEAVPPLPADLPLHVRELIAVTMTKDPVLRYRSGGEFAEAVALVRAGHRPPRPRGSALSTSATVVETDPPATDSRHNVPGVSKILDEHRRSDRLQETLMETDTAETTPDPGCPVEKPAAVPLLSIGFHQNPSELYREIRREHGPVVAVELPGGIPAWMVIGYREMHQVLSDSELFPRNASLWNQWPNIPPDWALRPMFGQDVPSVYFTAGAEHRRHRSMVEPALEWVDPFALRFTCEELADRLVDGFCGRGEADLVSEFAVLLPILVMGRLLGIPDAEGPELAQVMGDIGGGGEAAPAALVRFTTMMQELIAAKKLRPGQDLTSRMIASPEPFSDAEYVADIQAVLAAGHMTTAYWLVNSLQLMLLDDRFAMAFAGGRRSVGEAMIEVLWEESPNQCLTGRCATRDTQLGDKMIRAGDMVLLGIGAANGDPHVRNPVVDDSGDVHNSAHFSFGHGEYDCPFPARQLAELIAQTGIEVLLDRLPDVDLAIAPDALTRTPSPFFCGMLSLPVRFSPVRAVGAAAAS